MSDLNLDNLSDEEFLKQGAPEPIAESEVIENSETTPPVEDTSTQEVNPEDALEFPEDFDYRAEYTKLCKPFKANGQTVTIRNADEIISLMQKGIGYTAKSQKLQEQVKLAAMIEAAGISKEDLNLLIDANKSNPQALQKLIKKSNIDPLDLDMTDEANSNYSPNNYEISDEELTFKSVVEDLNRNEYGKQLLSDVRDWDNQSKDTVWKQPNLLGVLAEQVESGVYSTITKEVARRKLLGTIDNNVPFLHAYHEIGNQLLEAKAKGSNSQVAKVAASPQRNIVDRRVTTPKPNYVNSDKVQAASSKSTNTPSSGKVINPMLMSDEDFMKLAQPR